MRSSLEQFLVVKRGISCIVGSAQGGIQWGILTSDFLLSKCLSSDRFERIGCLLLDRSVHDLSRSIPGSSDDIRLVIKPMLASNEVEEIEKVLESLVEGVEGERTVLFVHSISELVVRMGPSFIPRFLKKCAHLQVHAVICTVHQTLHSSQQLGWLRSMFAAVAVVKPNDGTVAAQVVAEIKSIRRSAQSGKISEDDELFGHKDGLVLLSSAGQRKPVDDKGEVEAVTKSHVASPLTELASSNATIIESTVEDVGVFHPPGGKLVTFDSTDPEFDEDSDPDNDLDL